MRAPRAKSLLRAFGAGCAAVLAVALATPAIAAPEAEPTLAEGESGKWVIPPVEEKLLARLLGAGAVLPDGCRIVGGGIEYAVVKGIYRCGESEIGVLLAHPSQAGSDAIVTERFALSVEDGTPPEGLLDAIEKNVRQNEIEFDWQWVVARQGPPPGSGEGWPWQYAVGAIAVVALAALGWAFRRQI